MEYFESRVAKIIFELILLLLGFLTIKFLLPWKIPLKIKTKRDLDIVKIAGWLALGLIFLFFFIYNN